MPKQMKRNKFLLISTCILTLCILGLILFIKSPLFKVSLSTQEIHLEIGTKAETDPHFYLKGNDWCIPFSRVDTSAVKNTQVGRYPIYIYHGFQKLTCYVTVTDSTPPVVRCDVKNKTVLPGDIVSVNTLGLKIQDHSDIESIRFTKISSTKFYTGLPDEQTEGIRDAYRKGIAMEAEDFQFAYGGIYTLTITVTDAFYNASEIELILTVEQPPVIEITNDFYVADTQKIDFTQYITVWDFITEDMKAEDVTIDTSKLKLSVEGTYPVTLSATDDYGLTATKTVNVHVSSQKALQELINTHAINSTTSTIIGAKNAYDSGYYTSEDISFIQGIMLPSIVYIENDALDTAGSGFIIEITDEFITIATNEHVITDDLVVDITFFDAKRCRGTVVGAEAKRDIAFIRIPIDGKSATTSLPSEYVETLRTVHINKGYWDKLADDCRITIGYNCINEDGQIWKTNSGFMVEKEAVRDWNQYKNISETIISMEPVAGSSGSAIFDGYGHLVGMIRGYTEYEGYTETVAVPLNEILTYFQSVFKYKIHYQ